MTTTVPATPMAITHRSMFSTLLKVTIVLGIGLRLLRYLNHLSLYLDEAMLALNLVDRPFRHIFEPLDYNQGAPVGFLLLQRIVVALLGNSEYALRLIPVLAGCFSVPIFYATARKIVSPYAALWATALFSFAQEPILYAAQDKQYSVDVLIALGLVLLALRFLETPTRRRLVGLTLAAMLGPWFSHPAAFVVGAIVAVLTVNGLMEKNRSIARPLWLLLPIASLASFGFLYVFSLRTLAGNAYLMDYWREQFAPFPPHSVDDMLWYPLSILRLLTDFWDVHAWGSPTTRHACQGLSAIILILVVDGIGRLGTKHAGTVAILIGPLVLALLASTVHTYPFRDRLMLFAGPLLLLMAAASVSSFFESSAKGLLRAARALAPLTLLLPLFLAISTAIERPACDEIRPLINYLRRHARPTDSVYLLGGASPPYLYYTQHHAALRGDYPRAIFGLDTPWLPKYENFSERYGLDLKPHSERVWILFTALWNEWFAMQQRRTTAAFNDDGHLLDEQHTPGSALYLYEVPAPR